MTPCTITLLLEGMEVLQAAALLPKALVLFLRAAELLMLQAAARQAAAVAGATHPMSRAVALFQQAVLVYNCTSEGYAVISASGMQHSRVIVAANNDCRCQG